jgi:hypothetical protein
LRRIRIALDAACVAVVGKISAAPDRICHDGVVRCGSFVPPFTFLMPLGSGRSREAQKGRHMVMAHDAGRRAGETGFETSAIGA